MPGKFGDRMEIQNERSDPLGPSDILGKMNFEGVTPNTLIVSGSLALYRSSFPPRKYRKR